MAISNDDARRQMLDAVADATDALGSALALLGDAYERLDDHAADRLEQSLFAPVQGAYGRGQRTHAQFAARSGLPGRAFLPAPPGPPHEDARHLIEAAAEAVTRADGILATLQDSMFPVEFGDPELRSGLQGVRESLDHFGTHARDLVRTVGR